MAALGTAAIKSYADYEQLIGGVETLYGATISSVEEYAEKTGASLLVAEKQFARYQNREKEVLEDAANAYEFAGMSANEYMETVNGFAASLTNSLGEYQGSAGTYARNIVTDMADNANKMGTSIESIQNAYSGFAKGNFTMLDNLKLGYGGTKEEMERLLRKAEELEGYYEGTFDINNFADITDAIHIIQEEMGIVGTTAKEASTTISGSISTMKASWSNLITGIADENQDFDLLVNNFVESVGTVAKNLLPRVEVALSGIGKLVETLLPVIINEIPNIINGILPDLMQSGMNIITALIDGIQQNLPQIITSAMDILTMLIDTLIQLLPQILEVGLEVILQLAAGITEALPELIPVVVDILLQMVEMLVDNIDLLVDAAIQLIMGLAEGLINALPILIEKAPVILQKLVEAIIRNAPLIVQAGADLLAMLWTAIEDGWNDIVAYFLEIIPELIKNIGEWFSQLPEKIAYWLGYVIAKIVLWAVEMKSKAQEIAKNFVGTVIAFIKELPEKVWTWFLDVVNKVVLFQLNLIRKAKEIGKQFVSGLIDFVKDLPNKFAEIGSNIISGLWNGISSGWSWLMDSVKNLANNLFQGAKDALDIHSPSRKFKWIGEMCVAGMDEPLEDYNPYDTLQNSMQANIGTLRASYAGAYSGGIYGASQSIDYGMMGQEMKNAISGMAVNMDGRTVGKLVAKPVDNEIGRLYERRT